MKEFLLNYYYIFIIPTLSIAVFFSLQYLTRGLSFFVDDRGIKWRFLAFMAALQFFISILITWGILNAFSSDYLSEYETLRLTAIVIAGASPFNITILIWVALKLEAYSLMQKRYGEKFHEEEITRITEGKAKKIMKPKVKKATENETNTELPILDPKDKNSE